MLSRVDMYFVLQFFVMCVSHVMHHVYQLASLASILLVRANVKT